MKTTGKNPAQGYDEMVESMEEARENGLATTKGNSIYKQLAGEYKQNVLSSRLHATTNELVEASPMELISLSDIDELKSRTIIYLRACEDTSTFPTNSGLARSLGYSERALRDWRNKHPKTETGKWLEMFNDLCSDILTQSALDNNANSITSIFILKAKYGLRETNELVLTPNTSQLDDETAYSAEEIRKRYMLDSDTGTE